MTFSVEFDFWLFGIEKLSGDCWPAYRFAPVLLLPLRLFFPLPALFPPPEPAPPPLMNETSSSTSRVPFAPMLLLAAPLADDSAPSAADGGAMMTLPDSSTFLYRPNPPNLAEALIRSTWAFEACFCLSAFSITTLSSSTLRDSSFVCA